MTPDPVPAGTPLPPGEGVPYPWDKNDAYIWKDAILKYACIEAPDRNPLHASEFALSDTAQRLRNTYHDEEEKERAIDDRSSVYYELLETCLKELQESGVLRKDELTDPADSKTYTIYYKTSLLTNKVCPVIRREPDKMHDLKSILNT
jgi:hypothetical protein